MADNLVLLSGGLDSATLMAQVGQKQSVMALSLIYPARHNKRELEYAQKLTDYYQVEHVVLPVQILDTHSSLINTDKTIPKGKYSKDTTPKTEVPFRNGMFISLAVSYALEHDIKHIYLAAHRGDYTYSDCTRAFLIPMAEAVYQGTGHKCRLHMPYVQYTKQDIVAIGMDLNLPYELTWSCYNGREKHCGKCATCLERKQALGYLDPTKYEEY